MRNDLILSIIIALVAKYYTDEQEKYSGSKGM